MTEKSNNEAIAAGLVAAVVLWGANNAGTKYLVRYWPPIFVGCTRFIFAGLILLLLFRFTKVFGDRRQVPSELKAKLWWRGGVPLALYIVAFNCALVLAPISHVAVYLGAAPVWALLWEGRPERSWKTFQSYFAAGLALVGVCILFWPALRSSSTQIVGELLGLASSILWTLYGRQCRYLGQHLSGAEVSAQTFLRAGVLLVPIVAFEFVNRSPVMRADLLLIQSFCIIGSGVVAFALWNNALRHWKTSKVYLFNNLIPLSTMSWAHFTLGEPITATFWWATLLIIAGVLIGQTNWQKIFGGRWLPIE